MEDLGEFFREIQKAEYFDSVLLRLSIQDLEKGRGSNQRNTNWRKI